MAVKHIHHGPEGIQLDPGPDAAGIDWAEAGQNVARDRREQFWQALEQLPSLNEKYAAELAAVERLYADKGLEISPIVVLDPDNFTKITALIDGGHESGGFNAMNRSVLREYEDPDSPLASTYILGTALHESAHSTARTLKSVLTTEESPDTGETVRYLAPDIPVENFKKLTFVPGEGHMLVGFFGEEAFADLSRVRGSQLLATDSRADRSWAEFPDLGIRYINEDVARAIGPATTEGTIDIPVCFALLFTAHPDGTHTFAQGSPGIAAYGLELLDQRLPGLFDQMEQARPNPALQTTIINRINSIRPGLYQDLRALNDNVDDFKQGVRLIQAALTAEQAVGNSAPPAPTP